MYEFFKQMIAFRKKHAVIRKNTPECSLRLPNVSMHGVKAWEPDLSSTSRVIGIMFAGNTDKSDDIVYIGINAYWEEVWMELPDVGTRYKWHIVVNTYDEEGFIANKNIYLDNNGVLVPPRTVVILEVVER